MKDDAERARRPDDSWKDHYIDRRGCGGCTVRQFEASQARAMIALMGLLK